MILRGMRRIELVERDDPGAPGRVQYSIRVLEGGNLSHEEVLWIIEQCKKALLDGAG